MKRRTGPEETQVKLIVSASCLFLASAVAIAQTEADARLAQRKAEDRLTFQSGDPWTPRINVNADAAMVYGIGPKLPGLVTSWRDHGYIVDLMTGVAWGGYQDYLDGKFDGTDHWDQAQTDVDGKHIIHGGNPMVPYMSPGEDYGRYLSTGVKRALDEGVEAVYLEEPEFWARSGWEDNFKREWKAYYHEDWQAPNSSPDAQYRASKLKYFLYRRALGQVFDFVSAYGKEHGRTIPCYVATHSLINYANWRIVSPESSLISVGADGYIAQVWTGTARTPNVYNGVTKQRTFETAFLEYGALQNIARSSGKSIWYLNDPIEDNPNHSWVDYRTNWESTLTATLLQPGVARYEILPWPERNFGPKSMHPVSEQTEANPNPEKSLIPKQYETELQTVFHALNEMEQPASAVRWESAGTQGIGVLVSDTLMFQRVAPEPSDENLGQFYGLALPLLMRGVPVEPVQIESAYSKSAAGFLDPYKLLLLTYDGQKPPSPEFHTALTAWVKTGGVLIVLDDDKDPYNKATDWWNSNGNHFATPRDHLFQVLGLPSTATGLHAVGKGYVLYESQSPAALTYLPNGGNIVYDLVRRAAKSADLSLKKTNALVVRRGPYVVAAGLDKDPGASLQAFATAATVTGDLITLFDADLSESSE